MVPQGWSFDARQHDASNAFGQGTVPEGWYKVTITKSNILPTQDGLSGRLELVCSIMEGAMQGRNVFWNLNLWNKSGEAARIAHNQLAALSVVTNQYQVAPVGGKDTVTPMLHNIPFYIFVVVGAGNQGPINNVRGLRDINGNEVGKGPGGGAPQQPAPQVGPAGFGAPAPGPAAPPAQAWGQPAAPSQMVAPGGYTPGPAAPAGAPNGGWPGQPPAQAAPANPAPPAAGWQAPGGAPMAPQPGPGQQWGAPGPAAPPAGAPAWPGAPTQAAPPAGAPGPAPQQQWGAPGGAPAGAPWGGPR